MSRWLPIQLWQFGTGRRSRVDLVVLVAVSVGGFLAAPPDGAVAGRVRPVAPVVMGPVLSGSTAVWVESSVIGFDSSLAVAVADPAGPRRVVAEFGADSQRCQFIEELSASAGRLAFVRRIALKGQFGCYTEAFEVYVGEIGGAPTMITRWEEGTRCGAGSPSLDGQFLALVHSNCPGEDIVVRDVATGAIVDSIALSDDQRPIDRPGLELAGRFLAWAVRSWAPDEPREWVIVYDRLERREVYRVDLRPLIAAEWEPPVNHTFTFALDADGTVAALYPRYTGFEQPEMRVAFMTVDEPWPHDLGVSAGRQDATQTLGPRLGVVGRRIAVARGSADDRAVLDLRGRVLNSFGCDGFGAVDFDGERLVWVERDGIYNEPFPAGRTCPSGSSRGETPPETQGPRSTQLAGGAARLLSRELVANRRGVVQARIACYRRPRCKGRLQLQRLGMRLGGREVSLRGGARSRVRVRLNARGRRLMHRRTRVVLWVSLKLTTGGANRSEPVRAILKPSR